MFAGLCTISTNMWRRVRIETRDHSKISERPPACSASATTTPLKVHGILRPADDDARGVGGVLRRTETKYSSVTYGKSSTLAAVGTTLTAGFGYIKPGPVTAGEIVGTGGVAASPYGAAPVTNHRHTTAADRPVLMGVSFVAPHHTAAIAGGADMAVSLPIFRQSPDSFASGQAPYRVQPMQVNHAGPSA